MGSASPSKEPQLSEVTASASRKLEVPAQFLEGYPEMLAEVLSTGRRLTRTELTRCREAGTAAAEYGVSLRSLIGLYLGATRLAWRKLSQAEQAQAEQASIRTNSSVVAEAGFRAAEDATVALAAGYDAAHHLALRQEESARREFLDALFSGRSDLGRLAEQAQRFGLRLAEAHLVAVARADQPFGEVTTTTRKIESALLSRLGTRDLLVLTKDGQLACIAPSNSPEVSSELARQVAAAWEGSGHWRVGVGRAHRGPGGVLRSYEEACSSLDLAARLDMNESVVRAADFLVFQVLLRDRAAISDLITTVLAPLQEARGGAAPLVNTLAAYFSSGSVPAAAREMNLSVRAVAYRLKRVTKLTGYSPTDPGQRFTLEAAVLGARLLDWPAHPLNTGS